MATNDHAEYLSLIVINDGNGSQCRYSYARRLRVAAYPAAIAAHDWATMAAAAAAWDAKHGGERAFTAAEILAAASEVAAYYADHLRECAA